MPLVSGTRLGPFEVIAPLGAGGMGEVYRATDPRLGRDVAIKALPDAFARDPERLSRFEREARLLASLSHPNVAGIHGLEEVAGHRYLVLEFVEGETLAARLARGPLPPDEAIEVCRQVAAGVEAAHENGVIHRDLKPGNIMLTPSGAVKVLDFGLAKGGAAGTSSSDLSASPTMTGAATGAGVILGTAAYMSPEQARGRMVDRRTDVWSFGCVLYECLAGRPAFAGETVSDLIARILEREPDWAAIPAATPPRVVELLRRCLTKDATLRLRDIGEARVLLATHGAVPGGTAADERAQGRAARRWAAPAVAAALAVLATASVFVALRPARPASPVRRFRIPVEGLTAAFNSPPALSRDGSLLAYMSNDRVWIRRMDQVEAFEVPGSAGGTAPFWSWDGKSLGFAARKKIWTFTLGAQQSNAVGDIPESGEIVGGAWSADSRIAFAAWRGGLYEVPAAGGAARLVLPVDSSMVDFHNPGFLPDGRTLLLFVHNRQESSELAVVAGSPPRLQRLFEQSMADWSVRVMPRGAAVKYSPTGHLLVTREVNLFSTETWAIPFSASRRKVTGPAFQILSGAGFPSASDDGMLVAVEDKTPPTGQLVWMRLDGAAANTVGDPQPGLMMPALSPDGRRVAYVVVQEGNADVWIGDLARGTRTRLTSGTGWQGSPVWSPDGRRIYYDIRGDVDNDWIVVADADGGGSRDTVAHGFLPSVSPDGKSLVYIVDRRGNADLWVAHLDRGNAAEPFLATPSNEVAPSISPDGRWIAYVSDESGRNEVYVRRFPEGGARAQVSVEGGHWPRWSRRGDAIYYVNRDTLTVVGVRSGPTLSLGLPRSLSRLPAGDLKLNTSFVDGFPIDAHPDGTRLIGVRWTESRRKPALLVVENWFEAFRGRKE